MCGAMAVAQWLWLSGCGSVAVAGWLWRGGCDSVVGWLQVHSALPYKCWSWYARDHHDTTPTVFAPIDQDAKAFQRLPLGEAALLSLIRVRPTSE